MDGFTVRRDGIVGLVLVVCVFLLGGLGRAEEEKKSGEIREVVQKLQARYEQMKDLQADFKQTTKIEGFATPITSSGKVYIKKPGRLRWDYLDPNPEEIYVSGNEVKMYVPEHKQVLVGKLTQMAASQAPLELLQGVAKLEEQFDIDPAGSGERAEGGVPRLTLLPKSGGSESVRTVAKIVLDLNSKTYYIQRVAIHEIGGNVATFQFNNIKGNTGLKNALFDFTTPPGVEVVKAPTLSPP